MLWGEPPGIFYKGYEGRLLRNMGSVLNVYRSGILCEEPVPPKRKSNIFLSFAMKSMWDL